MSDFNYEELTWGSSTATTSWTDPTNVRLRRALEMIKSLPTGASVLEIGCGAGSFIRGIKAQRPDLVCYGSDISQKAITQAMTSNDGVVYVVSKINCEPFESENFDAVFVFDVLEHVDDPKIFLLEVNRVMKTGGLFYCFVPCEGDVTALWHLIDKLKLKNNLTKKFAGHLHYFSRPEVYQLFKKANFEIMHATFAEHILGQIIGVTAFILMNRYALKNNTEVNNEKFFHTGKQKSIFRRAVNFFVTVESELFKYLPSPNLHLVVKK